MKLSVCTLTKDDFELIIHGMVHAAPYSFYAKIQQTINDMNKQGYKIFFEGVGCSEKLDENATQKEKDIEQYFNYIIESMPEIAEACGLSFQNIIKYPEGSINADIGFCEMIKKLSENGFADDFQTRELMRSMKDKEFREKRKENLQYINTKISIIKLMEYIRIFKLIFNRSTNKRDEIIQHYRNKVAFDIIESNKETRNIIYYGEGHIHAIVKLFQSNGWKLENSSKISVKKYK